MGKKKYSLEFKRRVARHYLRSGEGAKKTAMRFGIDHGTGRRWAEHYKTRGDAGFFVMAGRPSAEFKETVVRYMLESAFNRLKNDDRPVLHSDQGWQYQMAVYQEKLRQYQLEPSMSRKGNCLDNAVMESFFGILKSACWYSSKFTDIQQLKSALNEYIHYYNNERIN